MSQMPSSADKAVEWATWCLIEWATWCLNKAKRDNVTIIRFCISPELETMLVRKMMTLGFREDEFAIKGKNYLCGVPLYVDKRLSRGRVLALLKGGKDANGP